MAVIGSYSISTLDAKIARHPLILAIMKTQILAVLLLQLFCVIAQGSDVAITAESPVSTIDAWKSVISVCYTVAPYTGILCSLAPFPTIRQIAREKTTGVMPLLPYSSMVSNSFLWLMYGSLKNLKSVFWTNSVGFLLGTYYFFMFSTYCGSTSDLPGTVEQHLKATISIILLNVLLVLSLPKTRAKDVIGKEGMISFIVLFASPLTTLKHVIVSKSATSIPLPFTIASVVNCLLWSVVGIFQMHDFYIAFPSVMGLCCAVAQLLLIAMYYDRVKVTGSSALLD